MDIMLVIVSVTAIILASLDSLYRHIPMTRFEKWLFATEGTSNDHY